MISLLEDRRLDIKSNLACEIRNVCNVKRKSSRMSDLGALAAAMPMRKAPNSSSRWTSLDDRVIGQQSTAVQGQTAYIQCNGRPTFRHKELDIYILP